MERSKVYFEIPIEFSGPFEGWNGFSLASKTLYVGGIT